MRARTMLMSMAVLLLASAAAFGQAQPPQPAQPGMHMRRAATPANRVFFRGPIGKWWKNSELVQKLQVRDDQVQQVEAIFQDHRLRLIDLHAQLQREEARLEPLIEADHPDEGQVIAQIDKVAAARAELEKANAQMLLAVRRVLSVEQWKKLQSEHVPLMGRPMGMRFELPAPALAPGPPMHFAPPMAVAPAEEEPLI